MSIRVLPAEVCASSAGLRHNDEYGQIHNAWDYQNNRCTFRKVTSRQSAKRRCQETTTNNVLETLWISEVVKLSKHQNCARYRKRRSRSTRSRLTCDYNYVFCDPLVLICVRPSNVWPRWQLGANSRTEYRTQGVTAVSSTRLTIFFFISLESSGFIEMSNVTQ